MFCLRRTVQLAAYRRVAFPKAKQLNLWIDNLRSCWATSAVTRLIEYDDEPEDRVDRRTQDGPGRTGSVAGPAAAPDVQYEAG